MAIHFVGLPVTGPAVSVGTLTVAPAVNAVFVVISIAPPTTVIPPLAVSNPVSVVAPVTARVLDTAAAPPEVTENIVAPELFIPFVTINDPPFVPT